jgi:hypothetical protein
VTVTFPQNILHMVFAGQGTESRILPENGKARANVSWSSSWDWPVYQTGSSAMANAGSSLSGTTTITSPTGNCSGSPFAGSPQFGEFRRAWFCPIRQAGSALLPRCGSKPGTREGTATTSTPFGADQYGTSPLGYPTWDTAAGIAMTNLDMTQFIGLTNSMEIPVSGSFKAPSGSTASFGGMITVSTAKPCDPGQQSCPAADVRAHSTRK